MNPGYLVCAGMIALALILMFVESRIPWKSSGNPNDVLADLAERVARLERATQRADRRNP